MARLTALIVICAMSCTPSAPPEGPIVYVERDSSVEDRLPCGQACARLRSLGCQDGFMRDGGRTCAETCRDGIADGLFASSWPDCVLRATGRDELRYCAPAVRCRP